MLCDALTLLQNRREDAAGIVSCDFYRFQRKKVNGLVEDVFTQEDVTELEGKTDIGHWRYPIAGNLLMTASSSPCRLQFVAENSGAVVIWTLLDDL